MDQEKIAEEDKQRKRKALLIVGISLLLLLVAGGGYYLVRQQRTINDMRELSALDKQMLQDQFDELNMQYEEFSFEISNDSIAKRLEQEQAKVQRLMEELKQVKSTDAAEISRLRRELDTLRKILKSYVIQIDSLNRANQALRTENKAQREEISRVTSQRRQLQEEKSDLSEKVQLAAKLSVSNFRVIGLNSRERDTKRIKSMKQLQINFQVDRNVTAEPGMKMIYLRLSMPDGTLMQQAGQSGSMPFESGQVPYSVSRQIEYSGEPTQVSLYWDIQEYLPEGGYTAEVFSDGYKIGRFNFTLGD